MCLTGRIEEEEGGGRSHGWMEEVELGARYGGKEGRKGEISVSGHIKEGTARLRRHTATAL